MPLYPPLSTLSSTTGSVSGPASYQAGGFVIDLSATFTSLAFIGIELETPGALPQSRLEVSRNVPSAGRATVKVMRGRYERSTGNAGTPISLPSGVTLRSASGTNAATVDAIGGTGNAETVNQLYSHSHAVGSTTATDLTSVELATGTDISAASFRYLAIGQ